MSSIDRGESLDAMLADAEMALVQQAQANVESSVDAPAKSWFGEAPSPLSFNSEDISQLDAETRASPMEVDWSCGFGSCVCNDCVPCAVDEDDDERAVHSELWQSFGGPPVIDLADAYVHWPVPETSRLYVRQPSGVNDVLMTDAAERGITDEPSIPAPVSDVYDAFGDQCDVARMEREANACAANGDDRCDD